MQNPAILKLFLWPSLLGAPASLVVHGASIFAAQHRLRKDIQGEGSARKLE